MRASLLASATARTLWCRRFLAASIQDLSPWRSQLFGLMRTTQAACTNKTRRWRLPRFDILPRMVRSPVEICLGTSPSQAAKSRPLPNASPVPMAATIALEMIGPMPGTLINRSQPASRRARGFDLPRQSLDPLIEPAPVAGQAFDHPHHACREDIRGHRQNVRQPGAQEPLPLADCNAALQQEGADLIDDAGALADQPLPHAVQRLQVKLAGGLRRHKLHRRPLYRFGDRLRIAEVILLSLGIRAHILRRHQPGIMPKRLQLAA